jgi:hypothetical protein
MAIKSNISFAIDKNGRITITVDGVAGTDCVALTQELEEALGVVIDRQFTQEYYDEAEERLTIKLGADE